MSSNLKTYRPSPTSQRAKAFDIIGNNTEIAAIVSKAREGSAHHHNRNAASLMKSSTSQSDIRSMSTEQQLRIIDNENAMQLMPEIEWAARVLVSSILSPKDMTKRELIYQLDLPWVPPTAKQAILDEIKREMEQVYGYSDSLYPIFKDALFTKGSHPRLVLPEAAVDKIINSGEVLTLEALTESIGSSFDGTNTQLKSRGYLGNLDIDKTRDYRVTMESFNKAHNFGKSTSTNESLVITRYKDYQAFEANTQEFEHVTLEHVSLTDNWDAIKLPAYLDAFMEAKRAEMSERPTVDVVFGAPANNTEPTQESFNKPIKRAKHSDLTVDEFRNAIYKSAPNNIVTHMRVPGRSELKRRSVGRPLVQSFPSEAVIPIHVPGDVRRKIGFILLYGETGHPITIAGAEQTMLRAQAQFNAMNTENALGQGSMGSMIISKAARNLTGGTKVTQFRDLPKIFEQVLEDNLIPRLMNGAYPGGAAMGDMGDISSLMVARILCSMHTRFVFVPAEMMTYFAFDYHDNGMGKSLLDANKMLIAMRSGLLLTRITGEMRNSIPLTKVNLKIDELDSDWEKTVEQAYFAISQTRQPQYPLSTLAVNDIMDWIHRAGFLMTFEGNPRMPTTSFDFEKTNHQNILPDPEFYKDLGKQLYLGFGIPPEVMGMMDQEEFATSLTNRNIMFTQTVLEFQKIASGLITDDHQRLILSDGKILNCIVSAVAAHWGSISSKLPQEDKQLFEKNPKRFSVDLVERIISALSVRLPSPDTTTLASQSTALDDYIMLLDKALPHIVGENVISADLAPEIASKLGAIMETAKSALIREFMANGNILPELFRLSSLDEEGKPDFDLLEKTESYSTGLIANVMRLAKAIAPAEQAVAKDAEKMNLGNEGGGGFGGSSFSDPGSGGGADDGLGLDLDLGMGGGDDLLETPPADDTTTDDGSSTEETPPAA